MTISFSMVKILQVLFWLSYSEICVCQQQAFVIVENLVRPNSFEEFQQFTFVFNGKRFTGRDTLEQTIPLNKRLDECLAILGKDTLQFFTKFLPNETYILRPGCCCAAFTLEAKNNPKRGSVYFKNKTNRTLSFVVAEANGDTVERNSAIDLFAHESAMCYFKPCSVLLAEMDYLDAKYDYTNEELNYDSLWAEQKKFILGMANFHFLHGEKVELKWMEKKKKIEFRVKGYLMEEEYNFFR